MAGKHTPNTAAGGRALLRGLALIVSLVAIGYLVDVSHVGGFLDQSWIDRQVRGEGIAGEALFVATGALFTAVGLPRQVVAFLAGYAFGLAMGTVLGLLAAVLGCTATFYYARVLGRALVAHRIPRRARRLDAFVHDHPFTSTLLIRLLPVGSNLLTSLAAGVSSVRGASFIAGSALGYVPQTVIFALVGSGIQLQPVLRTAVAIALFLVSGVLGIHLYRRYRRAHRLTDVAAELRMGNADPAGRADR